MGWVCSQKARSSCTPSHGRRKGSRMTCSPFFVLPPIRSPDLPGEALSRGLTCPPSGVKRRKPGTQRSQGRSGRGGPRSGQSMARHDGDACPSHTFPITTAEITATPVAWPARSEPHSIPHSPAVR